MCYGLEWIKLRVQRTSTKAESIVCGSILTFPDVRSAIVEWKYFNRKTFNKHCKIFVFNLSESFPVHTIERLGNTVGCKLYSYDGRVSGMDMQVYLYFNIAN